MPLVIKICVSHTLFLHRMSDRIARNSVDGGKIIYLLDTGELQSLKFPTHWFENTPQGRFMLSIAFGQAKYYVDNLSQNVHRGLKYKIKMGVWPALAPWGYKNDRNLKTVVLDPAKAGVIKKAFELYSTGKYTLHDMCMYFYENGIRERKSGDPPETGTVRDVFKRPFYYGYMLFKGELYKGTHTPIITKDTFDKVQQVIKERGWFHSRLYARPRYDFAFTGFIKCHYCGCSVTAESRPFFFPKTNNRVNYLYYHCTKKKKSTVCCQKGYTREEVLEKQFREMIASVSVSQAWATQMNNFLVQDIESQKIEDKNTSLRLNGSLKETEQKLDKLLEAYLDTVIDSETYRKKKNELVQTKLNLEENIKDLNSDNPSWIEAVTNFITCAQKCAKIARAENNCHDLADMAKKVGSKYFLKDKKIEFCLYFPYNLLAANGGAASFPAQSVPTLAFGQSKYYVDNLSENVKRGNRQKLRKGILPNKAPYGYLNEPRLRTIEVDLVKSKIVKKAFELFAEGESSIADIARHFQKLGITRYSGKMLHLDTVKRILSNKFYIGIINFGNETYEGTHKLFIPPELFSKVQEIIKAREHPKNNKHNFTFLGLARCAECGCAITAEVKHKCYHSTRGNVDYIYYRCTKKKTDCSQNYLREESLEQQLRAIVAKSALPDSWAKLWLERLYKEGTEEKTNNENRVTKFSSEVQEIDKKLDRLLEGYLDQIIDPQIYQQKKNELVELKIKLKEKMTSISKNGSEWLEPMREFINVAADAAKTARAENNSQELKFLAQKVGSNYTLLNRQLFCQFKKGFAEVFSFGGSYGTASDSLQNPIWWPEMDSNHRLPFYKNGTLTTELSGHLLTCQTTFAIKILFCR